MANKYRVPLVLFEQIDIPSSGMIRTSETIWKNQRAFPVQLEALLIDANSVTTVSARFGVRGKRAIRDFWVDIRALTNADLVRNAATDGAWPLWKFKSPVYIPPDQRLIVSLADYIGGGDRVMTAQLNGYLLCDPAVPVMLGQSVTVPSGGSKSVILQSDPIAPTILTDFGLWISETGTVAKLRGTGVKVTGGGMPDWSDSLVLGSVMFPDSNPAAAIWIPPKPIILEPGDVFEAEFWDTTPTHTVYLGAVGSTEDRSN